MHDCGSEKGLTSLQTAFAHYAKVAPLEALDCALLDAAGKVLAAPVASQCDLPRFTQSAMDGYALRHADHACTLTLVGEVAAGDVYAGELKAGEALRLFTGAPLPAGADTVVRQESVVQNGMQLTLTEPLKLGQDVRHQGEEMRAGAELLPAGLMLTPGRVAALAMAGVTQVKVYAPPRVAVIITGKEVARAGTALTAAAVHDANWPLISSWLLTHGLCCVQPLWVGDDAGELTQALRHAAATADLVLTTGGASVGRYDHLADAARQAGFHKAFHGVAQRPGKPVWFGHKDDCLLLALPGNPAAVLVGLYVHAAAILRQLQGGEAMTGWQLGRLASPLCAHGQLALLQRMQLTPDEQGCLWLAPLPHQASHMLTNLATARALVWLPAGAGELAAGETLPFVPLH